MVYILYLHEQEDVKDSCTYLLFVSRCVGKVGRTLCCSCKGLSDRVMKCLPYAFTHMPCPACEGRLDLKPFCFRVH